MVHAAEPDEIGGFFQRGGGDLEMLAVPGEGLRGDELLAGEVGGGGGELEHRDQRLVDVAEDLGLGDVGDGVVV